MHIKELTNDEFNQFLKVYPMYSIYQTTEYAMVMNTGNLKSILLGLEDPENHILAATILLIDSTKQCAYAPRGFLVDYQDSILLKNFTNALKKYVSRLGILSIRISPMIVKATYDVKQNVITTNNYYDIIFKNLNALGYRHLGYNSYFEGMNPRFVALLNLNRPYYMIFSTIHKEFRTKIRAASRRGVEVYLGGKEQLEYLYLHTKKKYPKDLTYFEKVYDYYKRKNKVDFFYTKISTAKYLKYSEEEYQKQQALSTSLLNSINKSTPNTKERNKLIQEKMKQDKLLAKKKQELIKATNLLNQYPDGIVSSSILILKEKTSVNLFIDGYNPKFKSFNSKHLLLWKLCEKYSNEGYSTFNLGGISDITQKENKYSGLNQFKLSFGATAVEYIGDLELITNKARYLLENNLKISKIRKK